MYADDLALISDSEAGLQHMLDIVSEYAHLWRYRFKSSVLVILEKHQSHGKRIALHENGGSVGIPFLNVKCSITWRLSAQYLHPLLFEWQNVVPRVEKCTFCIVDRGSVVFTKVLHSDYHKGAIAPLYIGIVVVGQHRSHTFAKSAFPWQ